MKQQLMKVWKFFVKYYFVLLALVALVLPDLQLRGMIGADVLPDPYLTRVTLGFTALWTGLLLFVCVFVLPQNAGRITYIVINSIFIILSFCQYVYFKIFGQFFWLKSILLAGEGADYLGYAIEHIDIKVIFCTLVSIALTTVAAIRWTKPRISKWWWALVILPVAGIISLHTYMLPETFNESQDDWDSWRKPRVVYKMRNDINKSYVTNGLYQLTIRDVYNTWFAPPKYGKKEFAAVEEYFAKKGEPIPNDYTGIFKGKNVIAVMLEGIDTWMIDEKYTPTMCYMMENGLNFTNFYSPMFGTGHTFNAEFTFNTGYYSPLSAVSATNFSSNYFPYSVGNLFKKEGYATNSFHYNESEFYNRGIMHKNFGYDAYNSFQNFGLTDKQAMSDSNIVKNDAIYKKMTEKQPFFDFVIAYSGHVPYTFDDEKLAQAKKNHPELIDPGMDKEKNNCMILAADTDDFFRQLLTGLEEDKLLDNTVIVVFTDHYAYGYSDKDKLNSYKNGEIIYRVPGFIYAKGLTGEKISKPAQTLDLLPTILNLFGIKTEARFIGNDIMSPENTGFAYFGNAGWLSDKMYFVPSDEEPPAEDLEYIREHNKRVQESFKITEYVITGDYFANK